jgi:RimJ/RimL family protein N-acetyltransferase
MRAMQPEDAESVHYYRNLPEVAIFQDWTPESTQVVKDFAIEMTAQPAFSPGQWYQIIIQGKADNPVIGDLAVCIDAETNQQAELGIALDPKYQKQGFATEAIRAIGDFLFSEKYLRRIHVSIDPRNTASLNLFGRSGFRQEARHIESIFFKGEWCDDIVMAVLKREWDKDHTKKINR